MVRWCGIGRFVVGGWLLCCCGVLGWLSVFVVGIVVLVGLWGSGWCVVFVWLWWGVVVCGLVMFLVCGIVLVCFVVLGLSVVGVVLVVWGLWCFIWCFLLWLIGFRLGIVGSFCVGFCCWCLLYSGISLLLGLCRLLGVCVCSWLCFVVGMLCCIWWLVCVGGWFELVVWLVYCSRGI